VVVQDVKQGSFGEDVGLNRGDVILEVNKQPVNNPDDFSKIESFAEEWAGCVFLVRPRGSRHRMEPSSWPAHFRNRTTHRRDWRFHPDFGL